MRTGTRVGNWPCPTSVRPQPVSPPLTSAAIMPNTPNFLSLPSISPMPCPHSHGPGPGPWATALPGQEEEPPGSRKEDQLQTLPAGRPSFLTLLVSFRGTGSRNSVTQAATSNGTRTAPGSSATMKCERGFARWLIFQSFKQQIRNEREREKDNRIPSPQPTVSTKKMQCMNVPGADQH